MLLQLVDQDKFQLNNIPYAATFKFEIWKQGYNYTVRTLYNGKVLLINACNQVEKCPIDVVYNHLASRIYTDEAIIKKLCYETPTEAQLYPVGNSDWMYKGKVI